MNNTQYHGRDFARDYFKANNLNIENTDVYCFGVFTGWSCGQVGYDFKTNNLKPNSFWGFDSFEGLPDEKTGLKIHPSWFKGAFDSRKHFNSDNKDEIINSIIKTFNERCGYDITMIKGFYSESLTDDLVLKHNMKPACFVDMDADLYISCYEAMDWMARNNLIKNTLFYFDDWNNSVVPHKHGEALAMTQICNKYGYNNKELFNIGIQSVQLINF